MKTDVCYVVERFDSRLTAGVRATEDQMIRRDIEALLDESLQAIRAVAERRPDSSPATTRGGDDVAADRVFQILTSRRFATCSKTESLVLRDPAVQSISRFVRESLPLNFYLDIGGGYSAALDLGDLGDEHCMNGLSFEPDCLHVLCLSQIARFANDVTGVYPPGIQMFLVIDNLVANYVNDIPLNKTKAFCASLEELIRRLGLSDLVRLLVESDVSEFRMRDLSQIGGEDGGALAESEYENILRFCGRRLSREEAAYRRRLYAAATRLSEVHLGRAIDGIHLTQRKGANTLSFRSFPGGSSRIQAGRACFVRNSKGRVIPRMLTSASARRYRIFYAPTRISDLWTAACSHEENACRLAADTCPVGSACS